MSKFIYFPRTELDRRPVINTDHIVDIWRSEHWSHKIFYISIRMTGEHKHMEEYETVEARDKAYLSLMDLLGLPRI